MANKSTLIRATEVFDNSDNEARTFDISASVEYTGEKKVANMTNGQVKRGDTPIMNFTHSGSSMSCTFYNVGAKDKCDAMVAADNFIADVAATLLTM